MNVRLSPLSMEKANASKNDNSLLFSAVNESSLAELAAIACDDRVARHYFLQSRPRNCEELLQNWVSTYVSGQYAASTPCRAWAVYCRYERSPIGMLAFHANYLRYFLRPEKWSKGYGRELVRVASDYLAPRQRLACLKAVVRRGNQRSRAVLETNKFLFNGLLWSRSDDSSVRTAVLDFRKLILECR